MPSPEGTYIATIDGVSYYTDRVVKGKVTFQANVGLSGLFTKLRRKLYTQAQVLKQAGHPLPHGAAEVHESRRMWLNSRPTASHISLFAGSMEAVAETMTPIRTLFKVSCINGMKQSSPLSTSS